MNSYLPARRELVVAILALSLGLASAALPVLPSVGTANAQVDVSADPQAVSPTVADLRAGFTPDPSKTELREPVPGIVVYEADFTREQTPRNFKDGPIEIKSLVARTASAQQAAEQFTSSRQALVTANPPWVETPVAKLGDEAIGLMMKGTSSEGPAVAQLFLYRRGSMVVGITVAGLEKPTKMAEAESIAALTLRRIDPTVATQRGQGLARQLNPRPSATTPAGASGSATSSGGSAGSGSQATASSGAAVTRMRVAKTDKQGVRLRAQPSRTATVASVLPEGTVVEVVGEDRQGDGLTWKNVRGPGDGRGWVDAEYLVPEPTPAASGSPSPSRAPATASPSPAGAASSGGSTSSGSTSPVSGSATAPATSAGTVGASGASGSANAGAASRTTAPAPAPADDVLTVDVTLAKTELRDGEQALTIKVSQQGKPVPGATATIRTTRDEQPAASPTDASGTSTVSWSPTGEAGFVGVGVSVTAPNGATGVGSSYFNLLASR